MTENELKQNIINYFFYNGSYCPGRWRNAKHFPEVLLLPGKTLSEKVWNVFNIRPKCHCGKFTSYININLGYKKTCSYSCGQLGEIKTLEKSYTTTKLWENLEWKKETSLKMREYHFNSKAKGKLEELFKKGIKPTTEISPIGGRKQLYEWEHVCGETFIKPFFRVSSIWCPRCHVSKGQGELYEEIKKLYSGKILANDRIAIAPKEIDIYLPDINIGFEYCGEYWHPGDGTREAKKIQMANSAGITILEVWENNWKKNKADEIRNIKEFIKMNSGI